MIPNVPCVRSNPNDVVGVAHELRHDLAEPERDDREVVAAEPQRREADRDAGEHRQQAGDREHEPHREMDPREAVRDADGAELTRDLVELLRGEPARPCSAPTA